MALNRDVPPQWLQALRNDLVEITLQASATLWPIPAHPGDAFFNYRLEHVQQVEREALLLHGQVGGDLDVILASVWVHDRFQPAFDGLDHAIRGARWASNSLAKLGFPLSKVDTVSFSVAHHSDKSGTIPPEYHEARVLWDADKLAHVAPAEMLMFLMNNLAADALAKLPSNPLPEERGISTTLLVKMMKGDWGAGRAYYFPTSKERAERLLAGARHFNECLAQQVAPVCTETGACTSTGDGSTALVRHATPEDRPALVSLVADFRAELAALKGKRLPHDHEDAAREIRSYSGDRYGLFVAEREGVLAGYLVCRVDGKTVWAESLFVLPAHRRKGVASALYAKAEELATAVGSQTVYNWIHPNNHAMIAFLQRRGYDVLNLVEVRRARQNEQPSQEIQVGGHHFRY